MVKILKMLMGKMHKVKPTCPKCGGKMSPAIIDLREEKIIYICESCGKQFV